MFLSRNKDKIDFNFNQKRKFWLKMARYLRNENKDSLNPNSNTTNYLIINNSKEIIKAKELGLSELYIPLNKQNLFCFTAGSFNNFKVYLYLEEPLESYHERFHAYNLFHKVINSAKSIWLNEYYHLVIDNLTKRKGFPSPESVTITSGLRSYNDFIRQVYYGKTDFYHRKMKNSLEKSMNQFSSSYRHVLITGWYGTETTGDKAILMEIISYYKSKFPDTRFGITSINEGLSYLTNEELDISAEVLPLNKIRKQHIKKYDTVIFGGGPLMDSSQLKYIELLFKWANLTGRKAIIFGCGVGPLKTDFGTKMVSSILNYATAGFFRDEYSSQSAIKLGWRHKPDFACDPALNYVRKWKNKNSNKENCKSEVFALLRQQTNEYSDCNENLNQYDVDEILLDVMNKISDKGFSSVKLVPMHFFWYGNDDRDYYKKLISFPSKGEFIKFENQPLTLNETLLKLSSADLGLPMRFHAHIFMLALGIPFISVNYTGKGKVYQLMSRYKLLEYTIDFNDVCNTTDFLYHFDKLEIAKESYFAQVNKQLEMDLKNLSDLYIKLET